jgi:hypothetical protein
MCEGQAELFLPNAGWMACLTCCSGEPHIIAGKEAEAASVQALRVDTRLSEPVIQLRRLGELSQAHDMNSPAVIIAQEHKG